MIKRWLALGAMFTFVLVVLSTLQSCQEECIGQEYLTSECAFWNK